MEFFRFLSKRLIQTIPLLILVSIISFFIIRMSPIDPLAELRLNPSISQETLDKEIKRLNNEFREIDRVTDVLSFPSFQLSVGEVLDTDDEMVLMFKQDNGFIHFGDMALCLKQTKRQAKEFGVLVESEIKKLVIHSMLHLMGYDHIEDSDYEIMKKEEERLDKIV